jgi:hypothetical protein
MGKQSKISLLDAVEIDAIRVDADDCSGGSDAAEDVRDYIRDMAAGLAELAYASRLDALAVACDVVREIAEGNVSTDTRLIRLS